MKGTIVICDDCADEAQRTRSLLDGFFQKNELENEWEIKVYQDADTLIGDISAGRVMPDAAFMDINLQSERSGIDAAGKLNALCPQCEVIYLTNYLEYAPDIFLTDHLYFVLKKELEQRLPEIRSKLLGKRETYQKLLRIELRKNRFVTIRQADVLYFERRGRKTFICGKNENWETYMPLCDIEKLVSPDEIIRCHNSYMVALRNIKHYVRESVTVENGDTVPISRKYQPAFRAAYIKWSREQM